MSPCVARLALNLWPFLPQTECTTTTSFCTGHIAQVSVSSYTEWSCTVSLISELAWGCMINIFRRLEHTTTHVSPGRYQLLQSNQTDKTQVLMTITFYFYNSKSAENVDWPLVFAHNEQKVLKHRFQHFLLCSSLASVMLFSLQRLCRAVLRWSLLHDPCLCCLWEQLYF